MIDTREEILVQLETLLSGLSGIAGVWRNRGDLTDAERPAAVLLDGVEFYAMNEDVRRPKSVRMPPALFTLKPQVFIVLQLNADPTNLTASVGGALVPYPSGPELSSWRMKVKTAIENDPTLLSLVTSSGQIAYKGCDTDMQTGSTIGALGATMQFYYEFTYMLFPPRS